MAGDELNEPLGAPASPSHGPKPPYLMLACIGLGVALFGVGAAVLLKGDPHGGEPYAVASIPPPAAAAPAAKTVAPDPAPTSTISTHGRTSAADIETESGVKVIRPGGTSAPDALIIEVPPPAVSLQLAPAPDPRLVERTHVGLLPKIGANGARPRNVYARPPDVRAALPRTAPRLALIVGGLGLSAAATDRAIADLPPAVTLAFAPYGDDLPARVAAARAAGHEVLLQVPMASFDAAPPGPHTLEPGESPPDVLADLHWLMARFPGYVGIGNFLGAKFTADAAALTPVLQDVADRGLLYFDDGSSARSLAASIAAKLALPYARADVILDAPGRGETIDTGYLKLEGRARESGMAIGMANDLPTSVERVARFARGLEARGIALVPLSATATVAPDVAARSP